MTSTRSSRSLLVAMVPILLFSVKFEANSSDYLPVFENLSGWSIGSNYGYHQKPGVNLRTEIGSPDPAGHKSIKVSFSGAGWREKSFERDIYLSLPVRIDHTPGTITWWLWGDGEKETVELHLRDSCGETLVWHVTVDWKGWKKIVFDGTKPDGSWGGYDQNQKGIVDPPIVRIAIDIMEGRGTVAGRRELAFADLSVSESLVASGEDPRPVLCIGPTNVLPRIDGHLDDACYNTAAQVTELFTSSGSPFKVPQPTEVFVTYDAANLYVAFHCHNEPGRKPMVEKRTRDGAVWEDDSVELMIAPPGDAATFHHIIVNALGDIYDEKWVKDPQGEGGHWDGNWNAVNLRTAATVDEISGGYSVEMSLPFSDVGVMSLIVGQPWRMNFSRMRRVDGKDSPSEASSWEGSQHFQSLDAPGWVWVGVPPVRVKIPSMNWRVGDNDVGLRISDTLQPGRNLRVEATIYDQKMHPRSVLREIKTYANQVTEVSLPIELTTMDDGGHVRLQLIDVSNNALLYRNLLRPMSIKHLFDFETDAVAYGFEENLCRIRIHVNLAPEELISCKLTVTWTRRATGKQVYRQVFDYFYDDPMRVAVSLALFPPGVYDLDATLIDGNNKTLERRLYAITRLPEREHRLKPVQKVDLGPNREIQVNGKPFFPLEIYHVSPEEYPLLKQWGFNAVPIWVGPAKDSVPAIDQAWKAGLYTELGLCDYGYNWSCFLDDPKIDKVPGARDRLREKVLLSKKHPGLFLYQLGDELANDKIDEFVPLYQEVKKLDPDHLQSMTTGPCWLSAEQIRKRATVSDIVSVDLYNVGQGSLIEHPKLCDLYRKALSSVPGKTLTKVPQATGYSRVGYRLPTPEEMRYMVYADLVHGAKGLSYYKWGASRDDPGPETGMRHDYRLMSAVRQLNWEITDLAEVILAGKPVEVQKGKDCAKDIELWCRESEGRKFLWAINHTNMPQHLVVLLPGLKADDKVEVFYEDRKIQAGHEGEISEELQPYAVPIYVWP